MYIEKLFGKMEMSVCHPIPAPSKSGLSASRFSFREHALAALTLLAERQGGHKNAVNHISYFSLLLPAYKHLQVREARSLHLSVYMLLRILYLH